MATPRPAAERSQNLSGQHRLSTSGRSSPPRSWPVPVAGAQRGALGIDRRGVTAIVLGDRPRRRRRDSRRAGRTRSNRAVGAPGRCATRWNDTAIADNSLAAQGVTTHTQSPTVKSRISFTTRPSFSLEFES